MPLVWDENAWADYLWWQAQDRRVLKRINTLIEDVVRNGNEGISRPEALKHDLSGYWSRRITDEHACVECLREWEWSKLTSGAIGTDVLLNVALFVPAAFLATLLWRRPGRVVLAAALGSIVIEVIQPLIGVGANDAVDVLANTAGAVVGALLAALLLLVTDTVRGTRLDRRRVVRLVIAALLTGAVVFGWPVWLASAKQDAGIATLQRLFAATTLADYRRERESTWDAQIATFSQEQGPLAVLAYQTDSVARERFTWTVAFASRCVIAEWTATGFTTIPLSGTDCAEPFHS